MSESKRPVIAIRGARQNNLKNVSLDLPGGEIVVVTGVSGSGKSSLVFDTLFAEGQRRYVETFPPYARQFLERQHRPRVDAISGIPPAIAIDQTNPVRSARSTVGTMTELADHLKLLYAREHPYGNSQSLRHGGRCTARRHFPVRSAARRRGSAAPAPGAGPYAHPRPQRQDARSGAGPFSPRRSRSRTHPGSAGGGAAGGRLLAQGPPEKVAPADSHTGRILDEFLRKHSAP